MNITDIFISGEMSSIRAEYSEGLEIYVQRSDDSYHFEWSSKTSDNSSETVSLDSYDAEEVAEYINEDSDVQRHEILCKLSKMRDFLEPNREVKDVL